MNKSQYKESSIVVENTVFTLILPLDFHAVSDDIAALTLHNHSHIETFCCLSGKLEILTDDTTYSLSGGDLLFMPAGVFHRLNRFDEDAVFCTFGFYVKEKGSYVFSDVYTGITDTVFENHPTLFNNVYDFCRMAYDLVKGISLSACPALQMLTNILSLGKPERNAAASDDLLCKLDSVINNNFMATISAESIAKELNVSIRQLSRIAKKRYGVSLHKVLTQKRLSTAAAMLRKTDKSVETVSLAVGYKSLSCFYSAFCEYYGTTPAEYRKNKN